MSAIYLAQNSVEVTLAAGGIDASQTTLPLASGEGVKVASTSGSTYKFPGIIYDSRYAAPHLDPNREIVLVTGCDGSSDTIATIARGQEGTSAVAHNSAGVTYKCQFGFTKDMFDTLATSSVAAMQSNLNKGGSFSPAVPYYVWGANDSPAVGTAASLAANQALLQPHIFRRTGTIDRILIQRTATGTGGVTANVKMAVYSAPSLINIVPTTRVLASGVLTASLTGNNGGGNTYCYLWDGISLSVIAGQCYFWGILCDGSITNFSAPALSDLENILGVLSYTANNAITDYSALATAVTAGLYTNGFDATWNDASYPLIANAYNNFSVFYRWAA